MRYPILLVLVVAACGSSSNNNKVDADTTKKDAKVWMDAPPNVPAMITISGTVQDQGQSGSTPLAGATVGIFKRGSESSPLGTATSDAQGKYSIKLTTSGMVVDGFIKTSASGHPDNYSFPTKPWEADDASADPQMITNSNFAGLVLVMGSSQDQGVIIINVVDSGGHAVPGAVVSTTPAATKIEYSGTLGPDGSKHMTQDDGLAYVSGGVASGDVTVSADKAGAVFKSHVITGHGNAFTTTAITE